MSGVVAEPWKEVAGLYGRRGWDIVPAGPGHPWDFALANPSTRDIEAIVEAHRRTNRIDAFPTITVKRSKVLRMAKLVDKQTRVHMALRFHGSPWLVRVSTVSELVSRPYDLLSPRGAPQEPYIHFTIGEFVLLFPDC